ncbi:MAG: late competence development ComFB family protein [Gemmatimonadales bacterium]
MKYKNLVEDHVVEAYGKLKSHFPEFCDCEICRADVVVFALNRLPPRYVATLEGTVVTEVSLDKQQGRASIDVAVLDGFKRVARSPRCGRTANRDR